MDLPTEIRLHIEAHRFDALEDHWLAQLEDVRTEPTYFMAMARAMVKAGASDRARPLLEMLDEHLCQREAWAARFEVLREFSDLILKPQTLHRTLLDTLKQIYGHLPSFEPMIEKIGLRRAPDDIPKTWKKAERLAGLMAFDVGTLVHMEGQGIGEVTEVNMVLESFKVEFESPPEIRVGFHAAPKMLSVPPEHHVLRRKLEDSAELERLRDEDPPELLRLVLQSYDQPRGAADIRRDLAGIVTESKWNTWWATARKHPQVLTATKGRQAYTWAASTAHAWESVWKSFEGAAPRTQIDLLRRNGERDPELRQRMSLALVKVAAECWSSDPGLACEIWFGLERSGDMPPGSLPWRPAKLVAELEDLKPLLRGIEDRAARERVYALIRGHREDWYEVLMLALWNEPEARLLDYLSDALTQANRPELDSFLDQLLSQPRKAPEAFVWFAERAAERPSWLDRNPMRLLKQIFSAIGHVEFSSHRTRLSTLFDTGFTVPRLLSVISEEQAPQALETIERVPDLEDYQRDLLRNSLLLKFPSLRKQEEAPLYATPEAIEAKRGELREIAEVELPRNRRAIEEARAMGDLRENFEYKSARQRHEYLSSRASALDRDLARVRPIDLSTWGGEEVVLGSRVKLRADDGKVRQLTILGPWDSKPEDDILSNESEQAQLLLGRKRGERAVLGGVEFAIEDLEAYR